MAGQTTKGANLKPLKDERQAKKAGYAPEGDEKKVFDQWKRRKGELLKSRTNVMGMNIDDQMRSWDRQYFNRTADIPPSELDPQQRPVAMVNAYGKVQTALSIMIDRNPEIVLHDTNPKYSATRELMKGLATTSWQKTNSLGQFKLSIFNCAKRGWFVGRTYNRRLVHPAKFLTSVEEDGKKGYEKKEITKMDDVAYQNINNFNAWIDEQAVPDDFYSTRDWMWREVWYIDDIRRMFPESEYPNMKFVQSGGDTAEVRGGMSYSAPTSTSTGNAQKQAKQGMTEVFFYENQYDDWLIIEINGVMVGWEPLPQNSKRLSLVHGYWNIRSAETIYGVGVVEMMEKDEQVLDRILNLSLRQLLLTISPPGFYNGPEDPENENIKYSPGVLRRIAGDTKEISWLQIPEGNKDGPAWIQLIRDHQDSLTGISQTLEGTNLQDDQNPTAFEVGVNREAGLQRLRLPLKQFQYALEWEFNNRIALIKQVYSDFQVEHIATDDEIFDYLDEVKADPDFYYIENEGKGKDEKFYAMKYREVELSLDQDEKGNFVPAHSPKFFKIKPEYLIYEGGVSIDMSSLLVQSVELEKADTLRMANIIIPLLKEDPKVVGPSVRQILQAFNYDAKKWLPKEWVDSIYGSDQNGPDMPQGGNPNNLTLTPPGGAPGAGGPGTQGLNTITPQTGSPSVSARLGAAFSAFRSPPAPVG